MRVGQSIVVLSGSVPLAQIMNHETFGLGYIQVLMV